MSDGTTAWLESLLAERFGHLWRIEQLSDSLVLRLHHASGSIVLDRLQPLFFAPGGGGLPMGWWDAEREGWSSSIGGPLPAPGASVLSGPLVERRGNSHLMHYDLLGLCVWAMGRVEEIGGTVLDAHERFPATASHAYRHGYLERPVVDEWLAVLGQVIRRQWPTIELRPHRFTTVVSHDVDAVSRHSLRRPVAVATSIAKDLLRGRHLGHALKTPWIRLAHRHRLHPTDPLNTFDWIMKESERRGLTSAFYFMAGRTDPRIDADYDLQDPAVEDLIVRIHDRGHEVGLHPSYGSYLQPKVIVAEAEHLRRTARSLGVHQERWGGRMHFLRWRHPTTLLGWEEAGMDYESTLGYADRPGFRCGTCFEYPGFDPVAGRSLRVRIRPLIAMECSVIAQRYMALGMGEKALARFRLLQRACQAVGGAFTLLWHNSSLIDPGQRVLYQCVLGAAD